MTVSLPTQQRIAELRQKAREGTMTLDDVKEGIAFLRQERLNMAPAKAAPKAKAAAPSGDDLLKELGLDL